MVHGARTLVDTQNLLLISDSLLYANCRSLPLSPYSQAPCQLLFFSVSLNYFASFFEKIEDYGILHKILSFPFEFYL